MDYDDFLNWSDENDLLPFRYDERRAIGVCLHLGCSRAAQGVVPTADTQYEHDCPNCAEHCRVGEVQRRQSQRRGQ